MHLHMDTLASLSFSRTVRRVDGRVDGWVAAVLGGRVLLLLL